MSDMWVGQLSSNIGTFYSRAVTFFLNLRNILSLEEGGYFFVQHFIHSFIKRLSEQMLSLAQLSPSFFSFLAPININLFNRCHFS